MKLFTFPTGTSTPSIRTNRLVPPFDRGPVPPSPSLYPDLVSAVVGWLRTTNSGGIAAAFGDTTDAPKFWGDKVLGSPGLPWLRLTELSEIPDVQSAADDDSINYYDRGSHQIDVFATPKTAARTLMNQVVAALNDAPLVFDDGILLEYRRSSRVALVGDGPSVGQPTDYHMMVEFTYRVQRAF